MIQAAVTNTRLVVQQVNQLFISNSFGRQPFGKKLVQLRLRYFATIFSIVLTGTPCFSK